MKHRLALRRSFEEDRGGEVSGLRHPFNPGVVVLWTNFWDCSLNRIFTASKHHRILPTKLAFPEEMLQRIYYSVSLSSSQHWQMSNPFKITIWSPLLLSCHDELRKKPPSNIFLATSDSGIISCICNRVGWFFQLSVNWWGVRFDQTDRFCNN